MDFGLTQIDADIYLFLAKKGTQKGLEIRTALKLTKEQIYTSLKNMKSKGIISSTLEHPARFIALPFEKVLDLFIKAKVEETQRLQQTKDEILANWENLKIAENDNPAKFTVLQGRSVIFSKIQQMIQETTKQITTITTVPTIAQADQRGIFDLINNLPLKTNVRFRFIAELSQQNASAVKTLLNRTKTAELNIEGRNPDLGLTLFPQMLIKDEDEAMFFVKPRRETSIIEQDDVCLWTDCKTLVKAFEAIFEELWHNSTDMKEKMLEIETGKPAPQTIIFQDAESAKKKYDKILKIAKEEIIVMTSSAGLLELSTNLPQLKDWNENNVNVKIMAPIVVENFEAAKQLSQFCSIKHVPPNYKQTIIVDEKHLFQLSPSNPRTLQSNSMQQFKNTFYTTDPKYIQKTKAMLFEIWKNSNSISSDNLESIFGNSVRTRSAYFPGAIQKPGPIGSFHPMSPIDRTSENNYPTIEIIDDDPLEKLTEQDILNEIINTQRLSERNSLSVCRVFSSQAIAFINPPDFFKLPPILIRIHHIEKHSTFGEEDTIIINMWLETPNGYAYLPVAVFTDRPEALNKWKNQFSATPAGRNVQLAKKGELQVSVHGNTMFAGWTKLITLFSQNFLPPSCILFEGYGNPKTEAYTILQPFGGKFSAKQTGFDAFVTFMHPSSKYSGPGTDGFLVRDFIGEINMEFIKGFQPSLQTKIIEKTKSQ
jgi:sugar-specific transcriptional regulator TrmB